MLIAAGRALVTRIRLTFWAVSVRLRLRARGCHGQISIGSRVRARDLPKLALVGERGGSVTISIGNGVDLGRGMLIDINASRASVLAIGPASLFEFGTRIQLFGGRITLDQACDIRDGVLLKVSEPGAELRLGDRVRVGRHAAIHCTQSVRIEDLVALSERVTIIDSTHDVDGTDTWTMEQPLAIAPVVIGRNALVYSGSVVLPGTTLGPNSVIAANALVPAGEHPAGVVLMGNPARKVRKLGD